MISSPCLTSLLATARDGETRGRLHVREAGPAPRYGGHVHTVAPVTCRPLPPGQSIQHRPRRTRQGSTSILT